MRFILREIILWLNDGDIRKLSFEPNKVNVITGDSGTGKTTILEIIDYCLFASKVKIPEEIINENVSWYGIKFSINDKLYTIARAKLSKNRTASSDYYFSGSGEVPNLPMTNITEQYLKGIIENEFSIDKNVKIPYGGKKLKAGSKISARYFLLFCTQSGDVITHSTTFFDKQDDEKYREALPRIFDLAIGIENVSSILIKEKIGQIQKELIRIERKRSAIKNESKLFTQEIAAVVNRAKEYDLIEDKSSDMESDVKKLKLIINEGWSDKVVIDFTPLNALNKRKRMLLRRIRNLKKFQSEYQAYKELANRKYDSLQPVSYILENYNELIDVPEMKAFLLGLEDELKELKRVVSGKSPLEVNVKDDIADLKKELEVVEAEVAKFPKEKTSFSGEAEKLVFIGETKAKLSLYDRNWVEDDMEDKYNALLMELEELEGKVIDISGQRDIVIKALEETIQTYLDEAKDGLDNYKGYKALFDYNDKSLQLRQPKAFVPSIVGSSSNHLFLHLCLFLGFHEFFLTNDIPYVPSYLILDQPSRPYFEEAKKANALKNIDEVKMDYIIGSDRVKLATAFRLLSTCIDRVRTELNRDFQVIVIEHVPKQFWDEEKIDNFYLVEEFRDGNALIPPAKL